MEIFDDPKDKILVILTEDEALAMIISLTRQILFKDPNTDSGDFFSEDARRFTIAVKYQGI